MRAWALLLLFAIPARAYADAPAEAPPQLVVPLLEGKPAPFQGLLVPELRFTQLLQAETDAKDFKGQLDIERNYSGALDEMYSKKLEEAAKPPPWYDTPSFRTGFGFTLGVLTTMVTVWLGTKVVKAIESGN